MTKIFDWKNEINEIELNECIKIIKNGGIVIFPTDTVYGIGCNCFDDKAINKIFEIKTREYKKPINVLCNDIDDIKKLAKSLSKEEVNIITNYMPGACTLIVNKNEKVSDLLTAKLDTVGVRIPDNKIARTLIKRSKLPLATTSANISGNKALTDFDETLNEFKNKADVIIDGGRSKIGVPSTIVKYENEELKILRQGSIYITKKKAGC